MHFEFFNRIGHKQAVECVVQFAHFFALQGQNHLFLEHEPATERFFEEIKLFLSR